MGETISLSPGVLSKMLLFALISVCAALQLDIHVVIPDSLRPQVLALAERAPHNQIDFVHTCDPHVTLYLTDFVPKFVPLVFEQLDEVVAREVAACTVELDGLIAQGAYAMWNVQLSACLQRMSDAVVNATFEFATPNQPVPAWVNALPKAERDAKTAMVKKYGSPNVFAQFQPHLTVAYDAQDNLTAVYDSVKARGSFDGSKIEVSRVGPHGTVLQGTSMENVTLTGPEKEAARWGHNSCHASDSFDWDYFLLVREWPATMTSDPMPSYVDSFTLHGLWPNRNDGSYPACCNNDYPFSYAEIASIIPDVERIWYDSIHDVTNGTSFWAHEWDKHGTCAMLGDPSCCGSELQYFQTCVNLHDQMKETKWLAAAGIVPADPNDTLYKLDDFVDAIAAALGQPPLIKCTNVNGNTVIENLAVCLDKSLSIIKCPENMIQQWNSSAACGYEFGLPVIPHD